jgi:hypothetical protein
MHRAVANQIFNKDQANDYEQKGKALQRAPRELLRISIDMGPGDS